MTSSMLRAIQAISPFVVVMLVVTGSAAAGWAQPQPPRPAEDTGFIGVRPMALEIDDCPQPPDRPANELEAMAYERYARGEISTEEYRERLDQLQ